MTRIVCYNILMGAAKRVGPLTHMLSEAQPDIVGLVEAIRPDVVAELGRRLGMQHIMSGCAPHSGYWQVALLSRLPVVYSQTHIQPHALTKPLLEVCLKEPGGRQITVFVIHQAAAFSQGWAGDGIRRREARELLRILAAKRGTPHTIVGDFNTLAPGDAFKASELLRYLVRRDEHHRKKPAAMGHPSLNSVVPKPLRLFNPLLRAIPYTPCLCTLFDRAAALYAPRSSISLLRRAGYIDCFRRLNPHDPGFTCPATALAGRIDFILASPELAASLTNCYIPTGDSAVSAKQASDHLPVVADFAPSISGQAAPDVKEYTAP